MRAFSKHVNGEFIYVLSRWMNLKSPTAVEKCRKERKRAHILSSSSSSSSSAFKSTKAISDRTRDKQRALHWKKKCLLLHKRTGKWSKYGTRKSVEKHRLMGLTWTIEHCQQSIVAPQGTFELVVKKIRKNLLKMVSLLKVGLLERLWFTIHM